MFKPTQVVLKGLPREPIMGRAKRGLYHGKHVTFGNNRAHSERKARRTWLPNVQTKNYFSQILNRNFRLNVTTKAIKCIDKAGGFDNYIMYTRAEYLGHSDSIGLTLQDAMFQVKFQQLCERSEGGVPSEGGIKLTSVNAVKEALSESPAPVASA